MVVNRPMKPLLAKDIDSFIQRFNNFKDGDIRSIEIISPSQMRITLAGQDNARSFDWVSLALEFSGVSDAKLIENSKLSFIDMSEGITLLSTHGSIAFSIGEYSQFPMLKNSLLYIVCTSLKYKEGAF